MEYAKPVIQFVGTAQALVLGGSPARPEQDSLCGGSDESSIVCEALGLDD